MTSVVFWAIEIAGADVRAIVARIANSVSITVAETSAFFLVDGTAIDGDIEVS